VVGGVGPVAGRIEGEGAEGEIGRASGREGGLALVDIGAGEQDRGGEVAGGYRDVLGHRAGRNPADHRHVVGAVDGDGDELAGGAVGGDGGAAVGDRLALA